MLSFGAFHHWPMRQLVSRMLDKSDAITLPEYEVTTVTTT